MSHAISRMEVVTNPDIAATVFVVDDDISVRESTPTGTQRGLSMVRNLGGQTQVKRCALPR